MEHAHGLARQAGNAPGRWLRSRNPAADHSNRTGRTDKEGGPDTPLLDRCLLRVYKLKRLNKMTYQEHAGFLILGSRMKRLGEKLFAQVGKVYTDQGIPFEPSWFGIFFVLYQKEQLSVSLLARTLGVSDAAVSQQIRVLLRAGLLDVRETRGDRRVRTVALSSLGLRLLRQALPVWEAMNVAVSRLLGESAMERLLKGLNGLEEAVREQPLHERMNRHLAQRWVFGRLGADEVVGEARVGGGGRLSWHVPPCGRGDNLLRWRVSKGGRVSGFLTGEALDGGHLFLVGVNLPLPGLSVLEAFREALSLSLLVPHPRNRGEQVMLDPLIRTWPLEAFLLPDGRRSWCLCRAGGAGHPGGDVEKIAIEVEEQHK